MERLKDSMLENTISWYQSRKDLCGELENNIEEIQFEFLKELQEYRRTGLTPAEIRDGKLLTGWIPVEERLPEMDESGYAYVLVSMDDGFVAATGFTRDEGFGLWAESGEVIAWMPLPEPEKDGDND